MEPVAGALHGGGMGFRDLLLARRLQTQQRAQPRVRLARHGRGLGAAAVHLGGVVDGQAGEAEAVGGVGVHGDDARGETGLEGVAGIEGGDGIHRAHVADRSRFGGVVGELREHGAEVGEGLAVVGAGGVGRGWCGLHEVAPVMRKRADVVVSIDDFNWSFILTDRGLTGAGFAGVSRDGAAARSGRGRQSHAL